MNQLTLTATILLGFILGAIAFSYKDAKNWGKKYSECNGPHQSPIIFTPSGDHISFPIIKEEIRLTDFNKSPKKMTIKNTGHTVELRADWNGKSPSCTGGPLHGNYVFEKVTFHWAKKAWAEEGHPSDQNDYSSVIDLMDMEMHAFFYRTNFTSFEKAETQKGGLAVFKLSFQIGFPNPTHWLDDMSKTLHKVRSPNSTAEIKPFPLLKDFDNAYTSFVFYEGSLDYPPCSESVTWFIVENGIPVIDSVVKEFKKIKLANGDVSNVRPTQPLNKRQVKYVDNHNKHM